MGKVSGGTTTVTIYSGSQLLAEYVNGAAPSSPTNEYIYAGNQRIFQVASGSSYYFQNDHLSLRMRTDASGNITDQRGTFPYGEGWYGTAGSTLVFTSYKRDTESGNDYAQARSYVSGLARFSSPDPIAGNTNDPQSLNSYSYVKNIPVALSDPLGLCPLIVAGFTDTPGNSPDLLAYAAQIGADVVFPYAGQSVLADVGSIVGQDLGAVNAAVQITETALQDAGSPSQNDSGNAVNVITFSGGAQAASSAVNDLGNVNLTSAVYLEPGTGAITGLLTGLQQGTNQSAIVRGKGVLNGLLNLVTRSHGIPVSHTDCRHSAACVFDQLSNGTGPAAPQNTDPCNDPKIFVRGQGNGAFYIGGGGGGGGWGYSGPGTWSPIFVSYSGSEGGGGYYFAGWWYIPGQWHGPTL